MFSYLGFSSAILCHIFCLSVNL